MARKVFCDRCGVDCTRATAETNISIHKPDYEMRTVPNDLNKDLCQACVAGLVKFLERIPTAGPNA